jgi:hypothetical protein
LPSTAINPQINETLAPYQFDGGVTISGSNISGGTSALAPVNEGLKAWTFPLLMAAGTSAAITTGSVYLSQLTLAVNTPLSNIYYYMTGSASALSTTASFGGLYYVGTSSTASLVASTAGFSTTNFSTAPGFKTIPLTAQFTTVATGSYYVALLVGATTAPTMATVTGNPSATVAAGPVLSAASYPFAINGTGASSLSTTLTLSSNTAAIPIWAAVA